MKPRGSRFVGIVQHLVVLDRHAALPPTAARHRRRGTPRAPALAAPVAPPAHVLRDRRLHLGDALRCDRPVVRAAALDRVLAHPVDVEQEVFAMLRGEVEHRAVGGHRVVDRLAEVPRLRRDRDTAGRRSAAAARARTESPSASGCRSSRSAGRSCCGSTPSCAGRRSTRSSSRRPIASSRPACLRRRSGCASPRRPGRCRAAISGSKIVVERIAERRREHHRARRARSDDGCR